MNLIRQARSQKFLRAGEVSGNYDTNLWQFWKSKLNIRIKVHFFQLQYHDKKNSSSLNIFIRKNKRCYVYLPIPHNRPSLSKDHQTVPIMNHCCYCFDRLWKAKGKYIQYTILFIVLCLNALAKLQSARRASRHPALIGNCPTCNHMPWPYQSTKWFVISTLRVMCKALDSVATRQVPFEKNFDMKCIQVNVLKNVARRRRFLSCYIRVLEWIYNL